jgi:hypothetical protein
MMGRGLEDRHSRHEEEKAEMEAAIYGLREEIHELIEQRDALIKLNFLLRTDLREYF